MNEEKKQRPRAFRLDSAAGPDFVVEDRPDPYEAEAEALAGDAAEQAVEAVQGRTILRGTVFSWSGLLFSALGGLASFAFALWLNSLVEALFARSETLGLIGLALAGLALLALLVLLGREVKSVFRQRRIASLHIALARAHAADDREAARREVAELAKLYEKRPETAAARKKLAELRGEIVDGRDLIDIAERQLMPPLDRAARGEIAAAAKRVSVVAALSPRAVIDVIFVAYQALRLIRRIAEIYGGRPGMLGAWRLARAVGSHLAITGSMALGDSLVQQILGHGIAAKISARLGEGVLNGMLTARIGLSAMAVCRPMAFVAQKPPAIRDVAPFLFGDGGAGAEAPRK
ncbi:TIGR01620 family protein [uncultured Rhodoblastus sp.]|uniref:YcjF family protein n=1 Tax=uncultured Rhodoblastus sp. TaxID=543037 RepID=UPI0025F5FD9B|nr:TIGR01620 family protein [uncultured Rhodoblastus sp.]